MFAVWHTLQPDGTVLATCDRFSRSSWSLTSPSFDDSREQAEESLRRYVNETMSFTHFYDARGVAA